MEAISYSSSNGVYDTIVQKLIKDGIADAGHINQLQEEIKYTGASLIEALVESKVVSEAVLSAYMHGEQISSISLSSVSIDPDLVSKIPKDTAMDHRVIPFFEDETEVHIAIVDASDSLTIDEIRPFFGTKKIKPYHAKESEILEAIDKFYEYSFDIKSIIQEIESSTGDLNYDLTDASYKSPVIRFVDSMLADAAHNGASDIHIQPDEFFVRVRYRLDGVMQNQFAFHKNFYQSIIVRMKIIGGMNIAESLRPQDGGIEATIGGRKIDFRVSIMPTIFGETIVIRILDKNKNLKSIKQLGLLKYNEEKIRKIIEKPEGVLIVTGPTGSGKTTSLYAIMSEINSPGLNMMTLEDPVEYHMPMAKQIGVNHATGIDFANGLRAILRQDPDVILVGEMRDEETAITAMRAAMTGHKVFSTLHTNDAPSAINRLIDLKVSPHMIASSVNGIVAQRLVRKLCNHCKIKRALEKEEYHKYNISMEKDVYIYDSGRCKECKNTGFKGRISIVEVIPFTDNVRMMVAEGISEHEFVSTLKKNKEFIPMKVDGIKKVLLGITSFNELHRCISTTN